MILGIEIGGTKLQLGVGRGEQAEFETLMRRDVIAENGARGILNQIQECVTQLTRYFDIECVGIGFGGPVDGSNGRVTTSHQIEGWANFPFVDWVRDELHLPALLGNDCDSAALAEAKYGAGRGFRTVYYVTVGTGVGGGLIIDGRIHGTDRPAAAEIGHLRPGLHAKDSHATVESIASGWGIAATARACLRGDSERVHDQLLPGGRVKILDDSAAPLPTGTIGEIVVQSPAASDCCLHSDTKSTLCDEDGWIRMNDLGRLDSDGRLYVTGRNRQDINVAGQKVNPREVEECILSHPAAREAVAVPSCDAWGEEAVKVVVVTNKKCSLNELVAHCRKQLADYKLPRFIEFRDGVPGGDQPLRDEFTD
jgi:acyl-CoA synthetase (AMP-forming)/AMP-acid ligase II